MARHASCQIGRGGSPLNTLGTRGTETGSPELSAAWRVLADQGPIGQEKRWAEVIEPLDRGSQAKVMADMRVAGRCE